MQLPALRVELSLKRLQGMVQPPAAGCTWLPRRFLVRRIHINWQHTVVRGACGRQSRLVGQSQVASQPDQCRAHPWFGSPPAPKDLLSKGVSRALLQILRQVV